MAMLYQLHLVLLHRLILAMMVCNMCEKKKKLFPPTKQTQMKIFKKKPSKNKNLKPKSSEPSSASL